MGEQQRLAVLLAVGGVIFVNVAAGFLTHITDPERLRAMAVESANDQIHAETLRQIQKAAPLVAAKIGPAMAEEWVAQTMEQYMPGAKRVIERGKPPELTEKAARQMPAIRIESEGSGNSQTSF